MKRKLKVAVLFGGKSSEHEVSLISAASIIENMDPEKYEIYYIGINRNGQWYLFEGDTKKIRSGEWTKEAVRIVFPADPSFKGFFRVDSPSKVYHIDVVFPVLHGPNGEDGTVQGLFELAGIPYVGCNVVTSSACMDKAVAKALLKSCGLPQGDYMVVLRREIESEQARVIDAIESRFGYPNFIKPANMGSSVGITKAHDRNELIKGLKEAAKYDRKIVIEEFINCREIECAVLGNDNPAVSVPGEILPSGEFYDYHAKYLDGGKSRLIIPANLSEEKSDEIRKLALKVYKALDCSGMARVDFFVDKNTEKVYINEVNTIPGFTHISMYPKLWEATGISYSELIDRLIALALERFEEKYVKRGEI